MLKTRLKRADWNARERVQVSLMYENNNDNIQNQTNIRAEKNQTE